MNVNVLNRQELLYRAEPVGSYIAEYLRDPARRDLFHIRLYDPVFNTIREISPDRRKVSFVSIVNCIWNCQDVYYASCDVIGTTKLEISIYKYRTKDDDESCICSFIKNIDILDGDKKLKVFILSESAVLMQTEIRQKGLSTNLMGNIAFLLTLYNLDTGAETEVTEGNFINNGINLILPVSEKKIMIKTGYSYLEDARLDTANEYEAFIESVYVTTTAKFIADIMLAKDFVDMPLIESAYLDKHITCPRVTEEYTHFSIVDVNNQNARCIFYHNETGEQLEYLTPFRDTRDLYLTYVVDHIPYVRLTKDHEVQFMNLRKAEVDITFPEETFLDQAGKLFLMVSQKRRPHLLIYLYPKMKQILNEVRNYQLSCCLNGDYYIYC